MSFTSHLRSGPLREWFEQRLPQTRSLSAEINDSLREGPGNIPCPIPSPPGSDTKLVGTAVGYLLAGHLRPASLDGSPAEHGALDALARLHKSRTDSVELHSTIVSEVQDLADDASTDEDWRRLCQLCIALGRFEQYFRHQSAVLEHVIPPLIQSAGDLDLLLKLWTNESTVDDLSELGRHVVNDWADLKAAPDLLIGPGFPGAKGLGGADGDVIYDQTLLDFKSSAQPGIVRRRELWQLAGYLLVDTDNRYGIRKVGFGALRWRSRVVFHAQDFVDELTGSWAPTIDDLRDEFREVIAALPGGTDAISRITRRPMRRVKLVNVKTGEE